MSPSRTDATRKYTGKYIKDKDKALIWLAGEIAVLVRPVTARVPDQVRVIDARSIGLSTASDYVRGNGFQQTIDSFTKRLHGKPVTTTRPSPGIIRLKLTEQYFTTTVDFDESKGYLPVSFEMAETANSGADAPVIEWGSTAWVKTNGTWVPDSAIAASGKRGKICRQQDLKFKWISVNETLLPETFMTRGMELPEGTRIADVRAAKRAVELGKIGDMTPHPRLALMEPPSPRWWQE